MIIKPTNRWLHVKTEEEKSEGEESLVLLPESYEKAPPSEYTVVIIASSRAGEHDLFKPGSKAVVPTHLIREIVVDGHDPFFLIEYSHVMAVLE